jgi:hypothetical protein
MHIPNKPLFSKYKLDNPNLVKILSAGFIFYSGYYFYLKRRSAQTSFPFLSYFYYIKKLFSRSNNNICISESSEKETPKSNISFEVRELPEHVKYDGGWYNEYDELNKSFLSNNAAASVVVYGDSNYIRESTPRGEIMMYYDGETKSFNYYSNSKNIPYSTLDAVARKYVCLNKDPSIYIDIRDEVQKGREKYLNQTNKVEKKNKKSESGILSSAKKSLFAAFKNYKTGRNAPTSLLHRKNEVVVMKDNINKFIYKGTLDQYDVDLKHKKHCELIKANECTTSNCERDHDHGNECIVVDHLKLLHEKQDLSYTEFKQKCNPSLNPTTI